jgi:DNA-directed RNA polymerase subunit delta
MKRIIKDYKNITPELLDILNDRYPEGIDEDDLISFTNHLNEKVKAVEIRFEDDIYLIKVSKQLTAKMDEAMDDDDDEMDGFEDDAPEIEEDVVDDEDDFDVSSDDDDDEDKDDTDDDDDDSDKF